MDLSQLFTAAREYGIIGVVTLILLWLLYKILQDHRLERKEWKDESKLQFDKLVEVTEKNADVTSGLKATLETFISYNKGDR